MKKFKDFLYDNNDVLIAFLILLVAALLIVWRMNAIIEYPKTFVDSNTAVSGSEQGSKPDAPSGSGEANKPNGEAQGEGQTGDKASGEADKPDAPEQLWASGAITRDVEVSVVGNSATEAINCLAKAGLLADYSEYETLCTGLGLDPQRVIGGTYTFKKGSTKNDIARCVNEGSY